MRRRPWSALIASMGLLLFLAVLAPVAHVDDGHHADECPLCHFAQHALLELAATPDLSPPIRSAAAVLPVDLAIAESRCASPRRTRGPPFPSR